MNLSFLRPIHAGLNLPCAASHLQGREIDFIPIHDGINQSVRGTVRVAFLNDGCGVGASYRPPARPHQSAVYWFDQTELDALFHN